MRAILCAVVLFAGAAAPAAALPIVAVTPERNGLIDDYRARPVDPRTLEPGDRSIVVRGGCENLIEMDASPSGGLIAVADCDGQAGAVRFLDPRRWTFTGPVISLPTPVESLIFLGERRVLAVTANRPAAQAAVYVLDPRRAAPIRHRAIDHTVVAAQRVGDRYAVVDADQRFDGEERDPTVLRIFDRDGRPRVVPLPDLEPGSHPLIAARGTLYVAAGPHVLAVDPATGRRRALPAGTARSWLAAGAGSLVAEAPLSTVTLGRTRDAIRVLDRRTGRLLRRRPAHAETAGFGSGWAELRSARPGQAALTAVDLDGRVRWRALRGDQLGAGAALAASGPRTLYVSTGADVRAFDLRTGRTVGRGSPGGRLVVWDRDGQLDYDFPGDHGDENDQ